MEVFAYDGRSPLSHFVDCLYKQQNSLWDAADRSPGGDWLTLEEVCREITANGDHGTKFQAAYHESSKAPVDKLTAAFDAHKSLLKQAWIFSQGECSKWDFGLALTPAMQAVSDLLPYLTPPNSRDNGTVQAHRAHPGARTDLFPKGIPPWFADVAAAILAIETGRAEGKDDITVLREMNGETPEDSPLSAKMASRINKHRGKWHTLPNRKPY